MYVVIKTLSPGYALGFLTIAVHSRATIRLAYMKTRMLSLQEPRKRSDSPSSGLHLGFSSRGGGGKCDDCGIKGARTNGFVQDFSLARDNIVLIK